ncbi:MAG: peptidoglycan DD-metalloendopeptidase family protein [Hyphomicrobiaceae bacterium]
MTALTAVSGCSADLSRFDFKGSGLRNDPPPLRSTPIPSERINPTAAETVPSGQPYSYQPRPYDKPVNEPPVRRAGLPEAVGSAPAMRPATERVASLTPATRQPAPITASTASGRRVTVVPGDTLYGISRRHHVSISELMSVNGLTNPTIHPGQQLALPAGGRRPVRGRRPPAAIAAAPPIATSPPARMRESLQPSAQASVAGGEWTGSHTVSPRDSLYAIARQYGTRTADLQRVNGITDPTKLRAGTVLKVPGRGSATGRSPTTVASRPIVPPTLPAETKWDREAPTRSDKAVPAETRVAVLSPNIKVLNDSSSTVSPRTVQPTTIAVPKTTAPPAAADKISRFRWPAKGRIIAGFGPRADNTRNDGINILVPQGSDVHAAEDGTVAYAGDELKGYGNLVLIRHSGNWVSAYAHNESLLVKRGDKVRRGQTIAKAGKTGAVDQPQVHFELRQGSKPIDPMPHLEK